MNNRFTTAEYSFTSPTLIRVLICFVLSHLLNPEFNNMVLVHRGFQLLTCVAGASAGTGVSRPNARAARPVVRAGRGAAGAARDPRRKSQWAGRPHGHPRRAPGGAWAHEARQPEGRARLQSTPVPRAARRRERAQRAAGAFSMSTSPLSLELCTFLCYSCFIAGLVKFGLFMKVIRKMLDRLEEEQKSKLEQLQQIQVDAK